MRRLGPLPLTGAEKQRRHRQRVKARLAEAERLKALFADRQRESLPGLSIAYDHILNDLGAGPDEREALKGQIGEIQAEFRAVLEARARKDLEHLRAKQRKRKTSLVSRLDAAKSSNGG